MKNQNETTLKDIAEKLKLSVSTVSRALRGSTEINPETCKQVLALAEELHYSPNPIALSLKDKGEVPVKKSDKPALNRTAKPAPPLNPFQAKLAELKKGFKD